MLSPDCCFQARAKLLPPRSQPWRQRTDVEAFTRRLQDPAAPSHRRSAASSPPSSPPSPCCHTSDRLRTRSVVPQRQLRLLLHAHRAVIFSQPLQEFL